MKPIGLYIHIPFCVKKCAYCDFNSFVPADEDQVKAYLRALAEDIKNSGFNKQRYLVKSIYFGGGTPSLIKPEYIVRILDEIRSNFDASSAREVTIEVNPESISLEKLFAYKKNGIDRISMGVQSFEDINLKILGRAHDAKDVLIAINLIKEAGFKKTSIDLIYGLPGQTLKDWENDLEKFLNAGISHISFYDLKIEEGTPFYSIKNKLEVPDNDLQSKMYKLGCSKLLKSGFSHYEISSFAQSAQESVHNSIYWSNEEYIGFGAGAYSYFEGRRFSRAKSIDKYIQQAIAGEFRKYEQEKLEARDRLVETMILNLRLMKGFSLKNVEEKAGISADTDLLSSLNELENQKLILSSRGKYRLSKKGILYYDTIASELL
ncbi:MAG: radical SAM family heme chaperone HemW [Candidatus Omnitrophica bacterium]|nr:radical SAM family heme chaperone HemW [Candidatus Omnitrophota bacterium]